MIRCVIFDFDDTLEDFWTTKRKTHLEVGKYIEKKYGVKKEKFAEEFDAIDYHFTLAGIGKNPKSYDRDLWFRYFAKNRIKITESEIKKLTQMYWRAVLKYARLYPETKTVLKKIKQKKAMITDSDGTREIKTARLKKLGIYNSFDIILTSDDTGQNKPSRKFYNIVCKKLKVKPEECVMVGDKPEVDLKLAKKLGMKTVWIVKGDWALKRKNKKFGYVDCRINSLKQLLIVL